MKITNSCFSLKGRDFNKNKPADSTIARKSDVDYAQLQKDKAYYHLQNLRFQDMAQCGNPWLGNSASIASIAQDYRSKLRDTELQLDDSGYYLN